MLRYCVRSPAMKTAFFDKWGCEKSPWRGKRVLKGQSMEAKAGKKPPPPFGRREAAGDCAGCAAALERPAKGRFCRTLLRQPPDEEGAKRHPLAGGTVRTKRPEQMRNHRKLAGRRGFGPAKPPLSRRLFTREASGTGTHSRKRRLPVQKAETPVARAAAQ